MFNICGFARDIQWGYQLEKPKLELPAAIDKTFFYAKQNT